jgi:hypothetical protein
MVNTVGHFRVWMSVCLSVLRQAAVHPLHALKNVTPRTFRRWSVQIFATKLRGATTGPLYMRGLSGYEEF